MAISSFEEHQHVNYNCNEQLETALATIPQEPLSFTISFAICDAGWDSSLNTKAIK